MHFTVCLLGEKKREVDKIEMVYSVAIEADPSPAHSAFETACLG